MSEEEQSIVNDTSSFDAATASASIAVLFDVVTSADASSFDAAHASALIALLIEEVSSDEATVVWESLAQHKDKQISVITDGFVFSF